MLEWCSFLFFTHSTWSGEKTADRAQRTVNIETSQAKFTAEFSCVCVRESVWCKLRTYFQCFCSFHRFSLSHFLPFHTTISLCHRTHTFRARMFCRTVFFLSLSRSVFCWSCVCVQSLFGMFAILHKTKQNWKAINYISDAGGIYHDIIQFFLVSFLWSLQKKNKESESERLNEKRKKHQRHENKRQKNNMYM